MFFKNRGKGMELYYFIGPFLDNYKFLVRLLYLLNEYLGQIHTDRHWGYDPYLCNPLQKKS